MNNKTEYQKTVEEKLKEAEEWYEEFTKQCNRTLRITFWLTYVAIPIGLTMVIAMFFYKILTTK